MSKLNFSEYSDCYTILRLLHNTPIVTHAMSLLDERQLYGGLMTHYLIIKLLVERTVVELPSLLSIYPSTSKINQINFSVELAGPYSRSCKLRSYTLVRWLQSCMWVIRTELLRSFSGTYKYKYISVYT